MNRKELVEKMLLADFKARTGCDWHTENSQITEAVASWQTGMDAALSVAIEELLKPTTTTTEDERYYSCGIVSALLTSRRAKLERVKTPEERVTVKCQDHQWYVYKDDRYTGYHFGIEEGAQIFRLGLVQQLKDSA